MQPAIRVRVGAAIEASDIVTVLITVGFTVVVVMAVAVADAW